MDVRVLPCIYMAISQATASRSKADCRRCALSLLGPRIASHRLSDQSNFLKQTENWNASFDVAQLFFGACLNSEEVYFIQQRREVIAPTAKYMWSQLGCLQILPRVRQELS